MKKQERNYKLFHTHKLHGEATMESIVKKLSEIESAASAIVEHAEAQKEILDHEYGFGNEDEPKNPGDPA